MPQGDMDGVYSGAYAAAFDHLVRHFALSHCVYWKRGTVIDDCIRARAREIATDAAANANL